MATVSVYDILAKQFLAGVYISTHTYKINLYSSFTFNAAATTKAAAESGCTQLASANGYTQDSKTLTTVSVVSVDTNDALFDFDNVSWSAVGGSIIATHAMIYDDSVANDPPLIAIDFQGTVTAVDGGAPLVIGIPTGGLFRLNAP